MRRVHWIDRIALGICYGFYVASFELLSSNVLHELLMALSVFLCEQLACATNVIICVSIL